MKKLILLISASLLSLTLLAQNEIELRTDGIVVPRTDTSSVTNPTEGMMIYDTNLNTYVFYDGTQWQVQGAIDQLDTAPCNPTHVGNITDGGPVYLGDANSIFVSGQYAYVASGARVTILDISDPTNPIHVSSTLGNALSVAISIYVSGQYAYVLGLNSDAVEIFDISDPTNPIPVGSIIDDTTTELDAPASIFVSGKYAYVASFADDGVEILDISDPANPTHVGSITDDATTELDGAASIFVRGKYAYVASETDDGVEILDISDPANPTHVGSITDDATTDLDGAISIYVSGQYAYVASGVDDGVEILDVSDPANPTHVGSITDDTITELDAARSIFVSGNYAYVTARTDDGVEILDISDPANPTHVGSITDDATTELDGATSIFISGQYAYVASGQDDGVEILDICGSDIHAADIGNIKTSQLDVEHHALIGGNLSIGEGMQVGSKGILSSGPLAIDRAPVIINLDSDGSTNHLDLHEDESSFARMDFSNTTGDEKWTIAGRAQASGNQGSALLNFFYSDVTGNVLRLLGDGDATLTGTLTQNSDIRLKKDIVQLSPVLEKLENLYGYNYNWKDKPAKGQQIGLIAQEVKAAFPELVKEDENGVLSVSYSNFAAVLLQAIKEQQIIINQQEEKNGQLEERIERLEKVLSNITMDHINN